MRSRSRAGVLGYPRAQACGRHRKKFKLNFVMSLPNPIFNRAGRFRSGWRLAFFIAAYVLVLLILKAALRGSVALFLGEAAAPFLSSNWGAVAQVLVLFIAAVTVGWACGYALEDLPPRALGLAPHRGWGRDLLLGSLVGALSLLLATLIAGAGGGLSFSFNAAAAAAIALTLFGSAGVFIAGAAAEEALFRGYPLQTLLRSLPVVVAVIPSSVLFAYAHMDNPNVVPGFTFLNTALAGVWLAIAYLRTRSLWFPLGVHWAWNWMMAAVLGIPVSGITRLTPEPLLRAQESGPAWLTGGAYGLEGGAACALALIISTIFIWRTRLLSPTEEMLRLTSEEIPRDPEPHITLPAELAEERGKSQEPPALGSAETES